MARTTFSLIALSKYWKRIPAIGSIALLLHRSITEWIIFPPSIDSFSAFLRCIFSLSTSPVNLRVIVLRLGITYIGLTRDINFQKPRPSTSCSGNMESVIWNDFKSNHKISNQIQIKSHVFQIKSLFFKSNHYVWFNHDLNKIMIWICPSLLFIQRYMPTIFCWMIEIQSVLYACRSCWRLALRAFSGEASTLLDVWTRQAPRVDAGWRGTPTRGTRSPPSTKHRRPGTRRHRPGLRVRLRDWPWMLWEQPRWVDGADCAAVSQPASRRWTPERLLGGDTGCRNDAKCSSHSLDVALSTATPSSPLPGHAINHSFALVKQRYAGP